MTVSITTLDFMLCFSENIILNNFYPILIFKKSIYSWESVLHYWQKSDIT